MRANLDQKINDWIKTGVRINGAYTHADDVHAGYFANPLFAGQIIPPWTAVYDDKGEYNLDIPVNGNTNPRSMLPMMISGKNRIA